MAQAGVTSTGVEDMKKAIREFPAAEQAALREVAKNTAHRELATARSLVRVDTGITRDAIVMREEPEHHRFVVEVGPTPHPGHKGHWATFVRDMLAIMIEFGTSIMAARPFMRPASDRERDRYRAEMQAASASVAAKVFAE